MNRYQIEIELMSDLCVGSGYSYAGIIDSDSCYDEIGLPFIPARRLKGCIKEAAELIGLEENIIEKMLGKWGQGVDEETQVSIYDAKIQNYNKISSAIKAIISDKESGITPDKILEQYTNVKAQTRIDMNGVAENNTLRFTRVVNQFDPNCDHNCKNENLVFIAEVYMPEELFEPLEKCVKAVRHIGMNRNRGLGNVRCELVDKTKIVSDKTEDKTERKHINVNETSGEGVLTYTIKTVSPIMMSTSNNAISDTYINGASALGYFATQYRKSNGDDDEFERLFLRGGLKFLPLYPSSEDGKEIFYPAPSYICQLKKSKVFVNTSAKWPDVEADVKINFRHGNQPKKLKGKYMAENTSSNMVREVETEIIYHNRRAKEDVKKLLYTSQAISKNQYFTGKIYGEITDLNKIAEILNTCPIVFGKSRTAQYGRCELASGEINACENDVKTYDAGQGLLVTLKTDAVFIGNDGYTVKYEDVRNQIKEALGIKEASISEEDIPYSELDVKELTGYYGVWNLKKQSIPAVVAGSTFEFILTEKLSVSNPLFVGNKNIEGLGMVSVTDNKSEWIYYEKADDMDVIIKGDTKEEENKEKSVNLVFVEHDKCIEEIVKKVQISIWKYQIEEAVNKIISKEENKINPSTIGRLSRMLEESNSETDLNSKINDIDDKDKKKEVEKIQDKYFKKIISHGSMNTLTEEEEFMLKAYALHHALIMMKYKAKEAK